MSLSLSGIQRAPLQKKTCFMSFAYSVYIYIHMCVCVCVCVCVCGCARVCVTKRFVDFNEMP